MGRVRLSASCSDYIHPQGGRILLDGQDYKTLNAADLRKCFGCVQQDTTLFNRTIEENIVYGESDEQYTVAEVEEAAREANAYDFIMEQEEGFQTKVGERGTRLSVGSEAENRARAPFSASKDFALG